MKKTLILAAITTLSFGAVANTDFQGHRVGAGISGLTLSEGDVELKLDSGFKIEYGYDINHIFGVNASYSMNSKSEYDLDYDFNTFKLDTDIGYAFDLGQLWLKPYGAVGLAVASDKISDNKDNISGSDTSLMIGLGVRAQTQMGIYADFRYDMSGFDSVDYDSLSFTVGYRF